MKLNETFPTKRQPLEVRYVHFYTDNYDFLLLLTSGSHFVCCTMWVTNYWSLIVNLNLRPFRSLYNSTTCDCTVTELFLKHYSLKTLHNVM